MNFPPIKIIENRKSEQAWNGPTGVKIATGTRYFAAVLAQETYEGARLMAWFWLPAIAIAVAAFAFGHPMYSLAAIAWIALNSFGAIPLKFMRERRETMGQAIEIAAIKLFYKRPPEMMEFEYRIQARSIVRRDASYISQKGFYKDIEPIDPTVITNQYLRTDTHPSIEAMIAKLQAKSPAAEKYVLKHWAKLEKWRPLGEESKGY